MDKGGKDTGVKIGTVTLGVKGFDNDGLDNVGKSAVLVGADDNAPGFEIGVKASKITSSSVGEAVGSKVTGFNIDGEKLGLLVDISTGTDTIGVGFNVFGVGVGFNVSSEEENLEPRFLDML